MRPVLALLGLASLACACLAAEPASVNLDFGPDPASKESRGRAHDRAQKAGVYNLRVRYVRVEGRYAAQVRLPIAAGDVLTPEAIFEAMEALEKTITADTVYGYGLRSAGELGVLHIDVDYDTAPDATAPDTVGVVFRPHYLRLSLQRVGDNVLPIPRSALPTFYDHVPRPLLALNPGFRVTHDRAFGTALGAAIQTDLFHFADPARLNDAPDDRHLDVHASGLKSVDESFYRTGGGLRYSQRRLGATLQEFSAKADFESEKEPFGSAEHTRDAGHFTFGGTLKLAPGARLSLDTGYRRTEDTVTYAAQRLRTSTVGNEQTNRILFDALPPPVYGFLRAGLWQDNGWLTGPGGSYHRFVARAGYAKDFPLGSNRTLGFEIIAGAGSVSGDVPDSARFFAGNAVGQFLYDAASSASLLNMPAGPIVRSLGEREGGFRSGNGAVRGGERFWHVNLNLAFPVRRWSRPLIPDEATDLTDAQGRPVTLKNLLRKQVDVSGPSMARAALIKEGMRPDDATHEAERILDEVRPAAHFIIDDASLYAVKPVLMIDAAGLSGGGSATWLAAGPGIQLTVVTAKLEAGYMRTLSGPTFGSRGNFFARLVFQNLF